MQNEQNVLPTWRELLQGLNIEEKKRIIEQLGIQERTLSRWIHGQTEFPRPNRVQELLRVLPSRVRVSFLQSVQRDPFFSKYAAEIALPSSDQTNIPSIFYARTLLANTTTPEDFRFLTVCQLVLLQMVSSLDAHRLGIFLVILKCTPPPNGGKVRTLSQHFSLGTPPWSQVVEQRPFFLGAKCIAGETVMRSEPVIIQDIKEEDQAELLSVHQAKQVRSCAAFPLQRAIGSAGAFLVLSTQPHFFTANRKVLIEHYCHLMAVALADRAFYETKQIDLQVVPSLEIQQTFTNRLLERTAAISRQAHSTGYYKHPWEIDQEARQQIESEMLETSMEV